MKKIDEIEEQTKYIINLQKMQMKPVSSREGKQEHSEETLLR